MSVLYITGNPVIHNLCAYFQLINFPQRLGNLEESRKYFEQSIERAKSDAEQETPAENSEQEPQVENAICVTTNYNLGRIYEGLFLCDKAEKY